MLTVKNIHQYYGGSHILRDVSFTATLGKVTVLLGRNGVGKTTLLKSLMGLVPIKSGSIEFDGQPIQKKTPYERARSGMGFVPQGREIFARLTVEKNLRMGLAYKSGSTPVPAELYDLFPVLKQMLHRRGGDLSGGQQQQLAIARALAPKPAVLFLDEPFSALDYEMTQFLRDRLQKVFMEKPVTTILVSHDLDEAVYLADYVLLLSRNPTRVADFVPFDAPRPRTAETTLTPDFLRVKGHSLEIFQREVRK